MKKSIIFLSLITCFNFAYGQKSSHQLSVDVQVGKELKKEFVKDGRLFLFINQNEGEEPRTQSWPMGTNYIFAKNINGWKAKDVVSIAAADKSWNGTPQWDLSSIPEGTYYIQVLWDQDDVESRYNAPGNIYSKPQKVELTKDSEVKLTVSKVIQKPELFNSELVKYFEIKSDTLSKWWGKPMTVKASILLPSQYFKNPNKEYPIRYNVAGYGGRYTRVNYAEFSDWWQSEEAPQIINVFLDGEGPFGDSYQMDSENSGPYGYSLIHEVIPAIEKKYRNTNSAKTRFVDGCSTGGWVSLALQLYYPDVFNGTFSYSPDAVEFENYQLINIYEDENAFVNEFGYERPVMRSTKGEPMVKLKDFIQFENVQGSTDSYLTSGGQFSAHTALYSPKGEDGLPKPLFDPITGVIDHEVAEHWKKYDFKLYAEKNWKELGPKLQGKIYIWMGDMDHFYLNMATRSFSEFLQNTSTPKSDAVVEFSPMEGHCTQFTYTKVLKQIEKRLTELD